MILAALPGMVRELLVTGKLVKPGNFSATINFLGSQIRKGGLAKCKPQSVNEKCSSLKTTEEFVDDPSRGDKTSIELFFGSFGNWTKPLIAIAQALAS